MAFADKGCVRLIKEREKFLAEPDTETSGFTFVRLRASSAHGFKPSAPPVGSKTGQAIGSVA